jgi:hypothetical protein
MVLTVLPYLALPLFILLAFQFPEIGNYFTSLAHNVARSFK